ncbi:MAG: 30S ribosomal protein S13 [Candidatus Micrarchaeota archaeon]|nr:30S ribosomal protein S13 [Candidatus Micrarchaeota archaeon]
MKDKQDKKTGYEGKPQDKKGFHGPKSQQPQKPLISASGKEIKGVIRIAGKDVKGSLPIWRALTQVKGVGINLAQVISSKAYGIIGANEKTLIGELSEEQVSKLEQIVLHPYDYGIPSWMFNRRKDIMTGKDLHVVGSDLVYAVKQDIDHEKEVYTWRGFRHTYGQKVRGQHTRSTGRTGMTVGVIRKSTLAKTGEAAAAQTGAAAQAKSAAAKTSAKKEEVKK